MIPVGKNTYTVCIVFNSKYFCKFPCLFIYKKISIFVEFDGVAVLERDNKIPKSDLRTLLGLSRYDHFFINYLIKLRSIF